jgi:hypothetical protein
MYVNKTSRDPLNKNNEKTFLLFIVLFDLFNKKIYFP